MKPDHFKNIRIVLIFLAIGFCTESTFAQQNDSFWSHVRFGGNIGIGFTNGSFSGILAPSAIYDFNPQVSAGLSLHIGYSEFPDFEAYNYGASLIGLYSPTPEIQLSAEFEEMGVSRTLKLMGQNDIKENYWYPALFLGAGYNVGPVTLGLRYDILYDSQRSIYASAYVPFARVFF